ncbi:CBS domain-containing protein [Candidatus Poribacteria bacterium]|nr:CBS domain-containing protein [Candidatus Poribacteria bacterium]
MRTAQNGLWLRRRRLEGCSVDAETLELPISRLRVREPVCVPHSTKVRDAVRLLQEKRAGCLMVTDAGKLVGIFTDRDAMKRLSPLGKAGGDRPLSDLMTRNPAALHLEDSILFAMNRMHVGGYRHIPLVDADGTPVGIISVRAVIDYLVEHFEDTVLGESETTS